MFVSFVSCEMSLFHAVSSFVRCFAAYVNVVIFPYTVWQSAGPQNSPGFLMQFHGRSFECAGLPLSSGVVRKHDIEGKPRREWTDVLRAHVGPAVHGHDLSDGVNNV